MQPLTIPVTATGPPSVAATPDEGQVRTFTRGDVDAVVTLRQQVFSRTTRPGSRDLAAFLVRAFIDGPWRTLGLTSLVHLDRDGAVNGFLGVVPRPMRFEGRLLRVAVPTQLMMRPGASAGSGMRLARAFFDGPQDLTISDAANEAARRLWERVGGTTSILHSLYWTLPLRRARYRLGRLGGSAYARGLRYLARPFGALIDQLDHGPGPAAATLVSEPFDPVREIGQVLTITSRWSLHPEYTATSLAWQLEEVARKRDLGALEVRAVRELDGRLVGWFAYLVNPGGVAEVVQLAAAPDEQGRLLGPLIASARAAGVVALAGRVEPTATAALAACGATFTRDGPWFLTHARDPRVLAAVLAGRGFLSRLEGEWWLNF
jgi:hypothetical protein